MAARKTVTKTVKKLPTTVKIPGGQASFYTKGDLPPRRERELRVALAQVDWGKARRLANAQRILNEHGDEFDPRDVLPGEEIVLTEDEARQFNALDDVAAWAFLKSWTLQEARINGETTTLTPRPLPENPDTFLDLPRDIYTPITKASSELLADFMEAQDAFAVDGGAGDDDSPTGPSSV